MEFDDSDLGLTDEGKLLLDVEEIVCDMCGEIHDLSHRGTYDDERPAAPADYVLFTVHRALGEQERFELKARCAEHQVRFHHRRTPEIVPETSTPGRTTYGSEWKRRRVEALRRDEFECQSCGIVQKDHFKQYGNGLHVHHIEPARSFSDDTAHTLDNLITLCQHCHAKYERGTVPDCCSEAPPQ